MQAKRRSKKFKENLSNIYKKKNVGEKNPNSKLTDKQREDIIEEYANSRITYNELAEKYEVHASTIQKVLNKK